MLTRDEMSSAFAQWGVAWNEHDLDGVMDLFHDEIYFENWTGGWVRGKENLRQAWTPWFANHGGFKFTDEETFIDESNKKCSTAGNSTHPRLSRARRINTKPGVGSISCTSKTARSFKNSPTPRRRLNWAGNGCA